MRPRSIAKRAIAAITGIALSAAGAAAAEVKVMISGGFTPAYTTLVPEFENATGSRVITAFGPSMGDTEQAIPNRIKRGEPVDVLIMVGDALGELIKQGTVVADSRVDLAQSSIGMVVRAGAKKPDISTVEVFKRALLEAKSIAYSDSASGVYISTEMFQRLGIADQVKSKSKKIPAEPVAAVVARGEAEIGLQQISALRAVPGVELLGPLPPEVQKITVFSAGIAAGAKDPEAGKALLKFFASAQALPVIVQTGLEPMPGAERK
jgi:molybdate transport system substrate-binding protein